MNKMGVHKGYQNCTQIFC